MLLGGALVLPFACTTSPETKDAVPARPGLIMPDASGERISEAAACSALVGALSGAQARLGCVLEGGIPGCPAYIRPVGGAACLSYDKGTVEGCTALIASFASCAELETKRCIVAALDRDPLCVAEPDGGGGDARPEGSTDASVDAVDAARDGARDAPPG
jgi:hypothetical protein